MIIDQLPNLASVQETDEIPVERGTTTYKSTLQKLKDLVASLLTKSDVGLGNVDNVRQYSANNPPNESGAGYCKMPDGTLLCWGSAPITRNAGVNTVQVTFPKTFAANPNVFLSYPTGRPELWPCSAYGANPTSATLTLYTESGASGDATIYYMAVGRWK